MTVLLECRNISVEYGEVKILDNINFKIKDGEKVGIVGSNGAGKTTLARIINGSSTEFKGSVKWYKDNISVGYMKQATEYVEEYNTLSGGEKTKKLLSKVLYEKNDMLILDEPTNHLDYAGIANLLRAIKEFKGTVLIISHDRYFLDKCVNRILEIEDKRIINYNGNYTFYRQIKKKAYEEQLEKFKNQQIQKERINRQIKKLKEWSDKAHKKGRESGRKKGAKEFYRAKAKKKDIQIKSRIKRLEKIDIEGVKKPKEEDKIIFSAPESQKLGAVVVRAENISKIYGKKVVFENSSFYIKSKERIGLYGVNGCGKTTLVKALIGKLKLKGNLYINNNSKIGYISQEVSDLDEESTILELFKFENRVELGNIITKLDFLGFKKETLNKKVKVLSLGERMKLKILTMIEERCDILILDEPTNHIDLHVREELEEALCEYAGTIILVTHDRYMLKKVCNKLLVFENKKILRCEYGIDDYLNKKSINKDKLKEDKIVLDNKISCIISELSLCIPGSEEYLRLDEEYRKLIELRRDDM